MTTATPEVNTKSADASGPAKIVIGLRGEAASEPWRGLFDALGSLFPVQFRNGAQTHGQKLDGLIIFSRRTEEGLAQAGKGLPAYLALEDPGAAACPSDLNIQFGQSPFLDRCLQNQAMEERDLRTFFPLTAAAGDEILAAKERQPLWIRRATPSGEIHLVAAHPPVVGAGRYLCEDFRAGRFMRLLPLLLFLKRLTAARDWQDAGRQACFIFDDPSLYWTSYGYLNFRQLAGHAREHDYYAGVATIALDTWWMHPAVLAIFRENAPRLSLLPHGNNHLKNELAEAGAQSGSIDILAQSLRRLARLERHPGLEVCRVMEAPGAALTAESLWGMRQLDFEGALVTPELLLRFNRQTRWPATLGLERANLLAGLPVLPRIKMTRDWKTSVRLAAALGLPIILVGHHEDAAHGLELPAEFARLVNGFGGVTWASLQGILRAGHKLLRRGAVLQVRMYSRRIRLAVPEGVQTLWIHRPWIAEDATDEILTLRSSAKQDELSNLHRPVVGPIAVRPLEILEIASVLKNPLDYRIAPVPAPRLWPVVRKVLMEARDRTRPLLPRKPTPGAGFDPLESPSREADAEGSQWAG